VNWQGTGRRFITEPLTVFVVIAAGIFVLDAVRPAQLMEDSVSPAVAFNLSSQELNTIVINRKMISDIEEDFRWLNGTMPSAEETAQLLRRWINEELVFREALAQQMYLTDGKMRAHFVEKVRLLWAGVPDDPSEMQLLDYYLDNLDEYHAEPRLSFTQVFYEQLPEDAAKLLVRLRGGEVVAGERYWLGDTMDNYAESILRTSFGGDFYNTLAQAPLQQWIGPVESVRGFHFLRLRSMVQPEPLAYGNIRDRVAKDWLNAESFRRITEQTAELEKRFVIVMEPDVPQTVLAEPGDE
jgi:hypothetical protein